MAHMSRRDALKDAAATSALPPICIKSRSTSATLAASARISTTSAGRNSASGSELYWPVTFPANFCRSADRTVYQQSHRAVSSAMAREVGDDANFQDND
jgi:hypothetical protein